MNLRLTIYLAVFFVAISDVCGLAQEIPSKKTVVAADSSEDNIEEQEDKHLQNLVDVQYMNSGAKKHTQAAFKSTLIINGQSIENLPRCVLEFRLSHRFGDFSQGARTTWGLDNATTRIGLNYGLTNWLMLGAGRSTLLKEYDGFAKIRLMRQTTDNSKPFSVSYVAACFVQTLSADELLQPGSTYYLRDRFCFSHQLLLARKFSYAFSMQLMPIYMHYNIVPTSGEPNDMLAIGIGGRFKVSNRIALTAEYYYRVPSYELAGFKNALSIGVDIETGGHVFQLFLTNSNGINEHTFIEETSGDWAKGGIHFGFNLSRVFAVRKHK